ncbi:hypothetical protein GCM10009733_000780 [Nonomuraea maheshkhaliensis]|uniref:Uncharacterized protein n=1 Tax=Nonomuraea maheshkhaliensis TaxID=419590 RepID=A0ABP4QEW0_9ACTN
MESRITRRVRMGELRKTRPAPMPGLPGNPVRTAMRGGSEYPAWVAMRGAHAKPGPAPDAYERRKTRRRGGGRATQNLIL